MSSASPRSSAAPDWLLAGKVPVVTGASIGGIGETYARGLAAAAAAVAIADIDEHAAREVADSIDGAIGLGVDITEETSVAGLFEVVSTELGGCS